jgi:hypothetical protein
MASTLATLGTEPDMTKLTPRGRVNLRLWSDETPLRHFTTGTGLIAKYIHDKGSPVKLANGKIRASKATRHYVGFENADVNEPEEANQRIGEILAALRGTELGRLIASDAVEAEICLTAFHGDVPWEARLAAGLIQAARVANVKIVVEHYDKFTEQGEPLTVSV